MRLHALDEGDTATWVFALIKVDGPEGSQWAYRTSASPNDEEMLGALGVFAMKLKMDMVADWD